MTVAISKVMIIKDHKDNLNRELSLVEQKKMQWAKERGKPSLLDTMRSFNVSWLLHIFVSIRRDGKVRAISFKALINVRKEHHSVR